MFANPWFKRLGGIFSWSLWMWQLISQMRKVRTLANKSDALTSPSYWQCNRDVCHFKTLQNQKQICLRDVVETKKNKKKKKQFWWWEVGRHGFLDQDTSAPGSWACHWSIHGPALWDLKLIRMTSRPCGILTSSWGNSIFFTPLHSLKGT